MKIAIADDELYVCQQIRECLLQYSTQKNVDMDAPDIYTDCRTLYNTDLNGKRYDVVFMDIDFSGENNINRLFSDSYAVRERCSDGLALGTYLHKERLTALGNTAQRLCDRCVVKFFVR